MKTLLKFSFYLCFLVVLSSCNSKEKSEEFLVIPVNVYQDETLPLSEITEEIRVIELETIDECLIGSVGLVFESDDYIIVFDGKFDENKIILFDTNGNFIRRISKKGQGPGEYAHIRSVAVDFENKKIYIHTSSYKLMCYDFEGAFAGEISIQGEYLNFTNNKLTAVVSSITTGDITDYKVNTVLYEISNDLQTVDSTVIYSHNKDDYFYGHNTVKNYLTYTGETMYFYYPLSFEKDFSYRDTLYQFNDKSLIPHLRLKFSDESSKPLRMMLQLYRSSRYVFARYFGNRVERVGCFCYDMKTGKGTNMRKGYMDDMYTGEKVHIYPFDSDANRFYFTHINMDESDDEEPNPTLYIGTLKK